METLDENSGGAGPVTGQGALAADLLRGVKEIAEFLGPSFTQRAVYHLVEKQALPAFRLPGSAVIMARKSEIERAFRAAQA